MLNQTQQLLEKHKYAFDWKAEIQRAEQASEAATANPWDTVHKPTPMSAFCGTTVALGGLKLAEIYCRDVGLRWGFFTTDNSLLVIGAFGALSALAFGAPAAPLGRPMVTFQGFGLVVTLAMSLHYAGVLSEYYTGYGLPSELEEVLMPALGISAMLFFNLAIHPPAAACVISYATADPRQQWPTFLVAPVLIGCLYVHFVQLSVAHTLRFMRSIKVKPPPESEKGDVETGSADGKKAQTELAQTQRAQLSRNFKSRRRSRKDDDEESDAGSEFSVAPAPPKPQEAARPPTAAALSGAATASKGWGAVKGGKLGSAALAEAKTDAPTATSSSSAPAANPTRRSPSNVRFGGAAPATDGKAGAAGGKWAGLRGSLKKGEAMDMV